MPTLEDRLQQLYDEAQDTNHRVGRRLFAEKCRISIGKLDGYLRGNGENLWETLRVIAESNKVSVSWLLGETEDRVSSDIKLKYILEKLSPTDLNSIRDFAEFLYDKAQKKKINTWPK